MRLFFTALAPQSFIVALFSLFLATPFLALAQSVPPTTGYNMIAPLPGLSTGVTLGDYLTGIFKLTIGLAGVLAVVMLVVCGIQLMMSGSVSGKGEAKKCIWNAIFGVLIAIGAWLLLNTINPNLVGTSLIIGASTPPGATPTTPPTPPGGAFDMGSPTASVSESAGTETITVSRVDGTSAATVHYMTSPGTAVPGTDYTAVGGTLTLAAGQLTGTITIPIINNPYYNPGAPLTFDVVILTPVGGTIGVSTTEVTIVDDDPSTAPTAPNPSPSQPPPPGNPPAPLPLPVPPPKPIPGPGCGTTPPGPPPNSCGSTDDTQTYPTPGDYTIQAGDPSGAPGVFWVKNLQGASYTSCMGYPAVVVDNFNNDTLDPILNNGTSIFYGNKLSTALTFRFRTPDDGSYIRIGVGLANDQAQF